MLHKTIESPNYGRYVVTLLADIDLTIPDRETKGDERIARLVKWMDNFHPRSYFSMMCNDRLEERFSGPTHMKDAAFRIFQPIDVFNQNWFAENRDSSHAKFLAENKIRRKAFPLVTNINKLEKWVENTQLLLGDSAFNIIDIDELRERLR